MSPTPIVPPQPASDSFAEDRPSSPDEVVALRRETVQRNESRNLLTLVLHHIVLRTAWIFKTESVIMPAFMDVISGAGWLRGCLPLFNRVGQSVPSLAFSEQVRRVRRKKFALCGFTLLMAGAFLTLGTLWSVLDDKRVWWLPAVFLVTYFLFFTATGLNQLAFGTLQGKLIRPERRGRLMGLAGTLGAIPAILCAWFLLQKWVTLPDGGFTRIFLFTGTGFVVAALIALAVREPADDRARNLRAAHHIFRDAWQTIRTDRNFRRFCVVGMLFMSAQMLFPHYQALGKQQAGFAPVQLMIWVVAQNAGAGVFSPLAGFVADRFGNRRALRLELAAALFTPLLALLLVRNGTGLLWYGSVFFLLGLVPVTMRTMMNYTLELCEPELHPQYLSTVKVCMALPFVFSPLFGLLIDAAGFGRVFSLIAMLIFIGWVLARSIPEPRNPGESKRSSSPAENSFPV